MVIVINSLTFHPYERGSDTFSHICSSSLKSLFVVMFICSPDIKSFQYKFVSYNVLFQQPTYILYLKTFYIR
nr:MAG TPA: hypothetical protein [Caudoviricetes sp.]